MYVRIMYIRSGRNVKRKMQRKKGREKEKKKEEGGEREREREITYEYVPPRKNTKRRESPRYSLEP